MISTQFGEVNVDMITTSALALIVVALVWRILQLRTTVSEFKEACDSYSEMLDRAHDRCRRIREQRDHYSQRLAVFESRSGENLDTRTPQLNSAYFNPAKDVRIQAVMESGVHACRQPRLGEWYLQDRTALVFCKAENLIGRYYIYSLGRNVVDAANSDNQMSCDAWELLDHFLISLKFDGNDDEGGFYVAEGITGKIVSGPDPRQVVIDLAAAELKEENLEVLF